MKSLLPGNVYNDTVVDHLKREHGLPYAAWTKTGMKKFTYNGNIECDEAAEDHK